MIKRKGAKKWGNGEGGQKWTHRLGFGRIISWLPLTTWPGPQKWSASRNSGMGWWVPALIFYISISDTQLLQWQPTKRCDEKWIRPAKESKLKFKYIEIDFCVPPDIPRRFIISHLFRPAPNGSSVFIEPDSDSVQRSRDPFQDSRTPDLTGRNQLSGNS